MFMAGTLSIDPSELTHIRKAIPQRIFKKLLYLLTGGLVSDQQEHETFTAISILQQLCACLETLGITNVIRLSKDGSDIYHDLAGRSDDMNEAMDAFLIQSDHKSSAGFETLRLSLEHETDEMWYLIQIRVNRTHDVGAYPIEIEVNGVPVIFQAEETGLIGLLTRFEHYMGDQAGYDKVVLQMKLAFGNFLSQLEQAIMDQIKVDHVIRDSKPVMIRPMHSYSNLDQLKLSVRFGKPFFQGHFGWERAGFYAFHWANYVHQKSFHVSDFILVDETDQLLMSVGPIGFGAGRSSALSTEAPFEPPEGGDFALPPGHQFRGLTLLKSRVRKNDHKGWFDFDLESDPKEDVSS